MLRMVTTAVDGDHLLTSKLVVGAIQITGMVGAVARVIRGNASTVID